MKKFKNPDVAILILRIFVGALFITHGVLKLTNLAGTEGFFQMIGMAPWLGLVVGIIETVAGLSMVLGYFTFASSIAIMAIMLVAIFKVKIPMAGIMGAEIDMAMFFSALFIFITGPGKYSLGNTCGCVGNCGCGVDAKPANNQITMDQVSNNQTKTCNDDGCANGVCVEGDCGCDCHK